VELRPRRAVNMPAAFRNASRASADIRWRGKPILYFGRRLITDRVAAIRMPAIYPLPDQAEEGGFIGYGPRITQIAREISARLLAKVLGGTKIADIPVEQPTKFELVINLKTADAMGVTVPGSLLARADKVIE
jgi:putative ABC transport system substrate-binding protein